MYLHADVERVRFKMGNVVRDLFETFMANPKTLPTEWYNLSQEFGLERTVIDYIAGMTDKYALKEHRRLFDPYTKEI